MNEREKLIEDAVVAMYAVAFGYEPAPLSLWEPDEAEEWRAMVEAALVVFEQEGAGHEGDS